MGTHLLAPKNAISLFASVVTPLFWRSLVSMEGERHVRADKSGGRSKKKKLVTGVKITQNTTHPPPPENIFYFFFKSTPGAEKAAAVKL